MNDLISRKEVLEELNKYENELRKDKAEAIETDDEHMLFAIMNQLTAICRIKSNIVNMATAYDIDKVVEELEEYLKSERNFNDIIDTGSEIKNPVVTRTLGRIEAFEKAIEIVKHSGVSDNVCQWSCDEYGRWHTECHHLADNDPLEYTYCPYCGKKIKVVE